MVASQMLLLLYKGLVYLTGLLFSLTVIATVDLSSEITLGSILIAFIIIAISGVRRLQEPDRCRTRHRLPRLADDLTSVY